ncbi:MAG: Gfo/Idh/MocA family oxidoreductase, partial [Candidatus Acidiferrum sp.]
MMKKDTQTPQTLVPEISRRGFLGKVSRSIAVATAAGSFLKEAMGQQGLVVPDPPGKKMGWAIVGLGSLSINQILPAFAKCERSKPVAFVSGHPDKANKLAARYGINPKNIYNYENYDSIRDNPEVDIIYIVLPNSMHAEYTIRGFQAGKNVLTEKPMACTPADCQKMIDAG